METHLPNKFLDAHQKSHVSNQWTDLVSQHLKCCFGHSEMPKTKSVSKVVQYNYLPEQAQVYYRQKKKRPTVASPTAANDLILGDIWRQFIRTWQICHLHLAEWKWCFICKRFKRYPSFAHKLNAQLDRSIATDVKWKILQIDQRTGSSYHSPTEEVL